MKNNTLAIALASMLVGGVAVGAYNHSRDDARVGDAQHAASLGDAKPVFADVVEVVPVTEKQPMYAAVIGTDAVRETTTSTSPREVCDDVVVQERLPERDGNTGGAVAGAVIGGLLGNQVGSGNGRKLATVAGAVGGGFAGREVDRRHVGGRVVERVDRQCRTVQDSAQSSQVVAWNVTYRNPDGTTGTMRTGEKPGKQISLGSEEAIIGYDVTYRYEGMEQTVRMERDPGERLPVVDGQVVTRTAVAASDSTRG